MELSMAKKRKPKIRHTTKFMGGRMTPDELHRQMGLRVKCTGCGQPAAIRIKVLAALDELTAREPELVAAITITNPDGRFVPTVQTIHGPMVKISDVGACDLCRKTAEIAAARGAPSWCIVEIDRGPGAQNAQVQVPVS